MNSPANVANEFATSKPPRPAPQPAGKFACEVLFVLVCRFESLWTGGGLGKSSMQRWFPGCLPATINSAVLAALIGVPLASSFNPWSRAFSIVSRMAGGQKGLTPSRIFVGQSVLAPR